ncbi:MAG TPA: SIS domain-containing protein [Candidatus Limnocylindria bacterium]|jgi:glucosamine--fructose-6-phosphate aminotransferase (isomerizing)|nr:SIS domain-containing protein [Candidatus Limnocylindria bacterium]
MGLSQEIGAQPAIAARLLRELPADLAPLAAAARQQPIRYVVVAARGSSDHAAIYAQYALGALARLPVALATPSLFSRYATPPRLEGALVIGISQSGQSPDVVAVIDEARHQGALTVAVTNDPGSPLAAAAEHPLDLRAGSEQSVAATKTYTAELMVIAMLAVALGDDSGSDHEALAMVPDAQSAALELSDRVAALADAHAGLVDCAVLGRGFNLATSFEWALKLKELAYVRAQAYSSADFQHGPVASLVPGGDVLAVVARGPLAADIAELVARLRRERRARVLVLAQDPLPGADHLPFPDTLPEWLSPLVDIIPAQLFTAALARVKGLDVERPRGLKKVTLTS